MEKPTWIHCQCLLFSLVLMRSLALLFFLVDCMALKTLKAEENQFIKELTSPLTSDARVPVIIGSAITGGTMLMKNDFVVPVQESTIRERPLGKSSQYGDLLGRLVPNAFYVLGAGSYGLYYKESEAMKYALIMIKATAYSGAISTIIKYTVREKRPNNNEKNKTSFPSGHTTMAFAFASTVGAIHGWAYGIPAYAMAAFVGYSRINDNAHWLHDVMAGATLGIGYGLGISYVNLDKNSSFSWVPVPIEGGAKVVGLWTF